MHDPHRRPRRPRTGLVRNSDADRHRGLATWENGLFSLSAPRHGLPGGRSSNGLSNPGRAARGPVAAVPVPRPGTGTG